MQKTKLILTSLALLISSNQVLTASGDERPAWAKFCTIPKAAQDHLNSLSDRRSGPLTDFTISGIADKFSYAFTKMVPNGAKVTFTRKHDSQCYIKNGTQDVGALVSGKKYVATPPAG